MEYFPVEIQFRTMSMDFWASMEHRINYKKERQDREKLVKELKEHARKLEKIEKTVFRYTSTIGLRKYPVDRTCMARAMMTVSLPEADIAVKKCFLGDIVRYYPEYESVRAAAEKSGRPLRILYEQAALLAEKEDERR